MTDTPPILFIVFNRPDVTAAVFEAIRAARPARLYVAADGPRPDRPEDRERCAETRRVATAVDWPCEVKTLFRDENLGCGEGPSGAITWFFEHEPEGIILEDDVLPDPSFFRYCAELLERYRDEPKVMAIGGGGYFDAASAPETSYCFCHAFEPWGWASWRRAWRHFDFEMEGLERFLQQRRLRQLVPKGAANEAFWRETLLATKNDRSIWDYQWAYAIFKANALVAYPRANLITNLGFRTDATHTVLFKAADTHPLANLPVSPLTFPLSHPAALAPDKTAEASFYEIRLEVERLSPLRQFSRDARRFVGARLSESAKARVRSALKAIGAR
jgi:hypothetical protein